VAGQITVFFGIASIIVGILTGSIFGIAPWGREWIPVDISFEHGNPMILFKISIALGIIHLTISFLLAALSEPHWQLKLTKIGSIAVLWGGALLVLGISFWWVALAAGLVLILLFFSDSKNIFKRLGIGLWGIYNHVSLIGDVMSYSRLFGLGIASAAIAGVVNQLATQTRDSIGSPLIGFIIMIVVLVVGHLFNLIIGVIGAVVHPARLHAVEALPKFVKFTGVEYKPLVSD
jgi:V/A-type H+-transporting ATPase subunit I